MPVDFLKFRILKYTVYSALYLFIFIIYIWKDLDIVPIVI
jgi:hypothetical protein